VEKGKKIQNGSPRTLGGRKTKSSKRAKKVPSSHPQPTEMAGEIHRKKICEVKANSRRESEKGALEGEEGGSKQEKGR